MPRKEDWTPSKTQYLWRNNHSGRYYLRAIRQGKEIWRSLGTADYKVAQTKLIEELGKIQVTRADRSLTSKSTDDLSSIEKSDNQPCIMR